MKGGLMVCGTASDVGKSQVVTGLCRLLVRRGITVAPFKAQNMALNSAVTRTGHEIGRAQAAQAMAARVEPEVAMNPILLKPTDDRRSQLVINGRPAGHLSAQDYYALKPQLLASVLASLEDLRSRFDVVVAEGAGSPAEINLLEHDIVNLRLARAAGLPAVVVGDIDRGGVFAALYGTVALLPDDLRPLVRGFIINKFRGDPHLLGDGLADLERRTGVPTLGVLPFIDDVAIDAEDSLALSGRRPRAVGPAPHTPLDVAVIRFPRLSNFTDLDALALEPGVRVRFVGDGEGLGDPDIVILPGTKSTVADLAWLRRQRLDDELARARGAGALILGVCGGFQMLGRRIIDPHHVESPSDVVDGLGWLDIDTTFEPEKVTARRQGTALGATVSGYEIHHGRIQGGAQVAWWLEVDGLGEGAANLDHSVLGTSLHGLFDEDPFRQAFLTHAASMRNRELAPSGLRFAEARDQQFDRLADLLEAHLDLPALDAIVAGGAPGTTPTRGKGDLR